MHAKPWHADRIDTYACFEVKSISSLERTDGGGCMLSPEADVYIPKVLFALLWLRVAWLELTKCRTLGPMLQARLGSTLCLGSRLLKKNCRKSGRGERDELGDEIENFLDAKLQHIETVKALGKRSY